MARDLTEKLNYAFDEEGNNITLLEAADLYEDFARRVVANDVVQNSTGEHRVTTVFFVYEDDIATLEAGPDHVPALWGTGVDSHTVRTYTSRPQAEKEHLEVVEEVRAGRSGRRRV